VPSCCCVAAGAAGAGVVAAAAGAAIGTTTGSAPGWKVITPPLLLLLLLLRLLLPLMVVMLSPPPPSGNTHSAGSWRRSWREGDAVASARTSSRTNAPPNARAVWCWRRRSAAVSWLGASLLFLGIGGCWCGSGWRVKGWTELQRPSFHRWPGRQCSRSSASQVLHRRPAAPRSHTHQPAAVVWITPSSLFCVSTSSGVYLCAIRAGLAANTRHTVSESFSTKRA